MQNAKTFIDLILQPTGMTLRRLSALLQIDSGWLAKYRNNKRPLPAPALVLLSQVYASIQDVNAKATPLPEPGILNQWREDAAYKRMLAAVLANKMETLELEANAAKTRLGMLEKLQEKATLNPVQLRWIESETYMAQQALSYYTSGKKTKLEIKRELLLKEAELLEEAAGS
jgi:hypothetical protein